VSSSRAGREIFRSLVACYADIEIEGEQPLPVAVHVLKACGLYGMLPPRGPTEVEDAVLAEQERQGARRRKALFAALYKISL
jgi:hypothetical protein